MNSLLDLKSDSEMGEPNGLNLAQVYFTFSVHGGSVKIYLCLSLIQSQIVASPAED